jgi:SAM-dependent methyltransferase
MANLFDTEGMAAGYATSRPPVHRQIIARAARFTPSGCRRAIDVGCGAGLSTRALKDCADYTVGLEPNESMLRWGATVAPGASFIVGAAESLPFADGSADLLTAAGSLNYVELASFFGEANRVLRDRGLVLVYDFGVGRNFSAKRGLNEWFAAFERRYPPPTGSARSLDPIILGDLDCGFRIVAQESFLAPVPLSRNAYVDYVLTETNVSAAVQKGIEILAIRSWCEETLADVWLGSAEEPRDIVFPSYFVCMAPVR